MTSVLDSQTGSLCDDLMVRLTKCSPVIRWTVVPTTLDSEHGGGPAVNAIATVDVAGQAESVSMVVPLGVLQRMSTGAIGKSARLIATSLAHWIATGGDEPPETPAGESWPASMLGFAQAYSPRIRWTAVGVQHDEAWRSDVVRVTGNVDINGCAISITVPIVAMQWHSYRDIDNMYGQYNGLSAQELHWEAAVRDALVSQLVPA